MYNIDETNAHTDLGIVAEGPVVHQFARMLRRMLFNKKASVELGIKKTHDPYWNAAQREMVLHGKMRAYMRMYWCKKIIEWTKKPEDAFRTALCLNNKYEIDGRDPNSFAGVAWCFGKHDRPWRERSIFGTVRYVNENGL